MRSVFRRPSFEGSLEELIAYNCNALEYVVFQGDSSEMKLKRIDVRTCPKLSQIYHFFLTAQSL